MTTLDLSGVYPPLATPFDDTGAVSPDRLASNVRRLSGTGLRGFVALGTNGEYPLLERDEKLLVFRTVRDAAPSPLLVIAGTGAESTRETITLTERAAALGVDAALVISPHYYRTRMDLRALVAHYTAVAECSPLPIVVYNMPANTGLDLDVATILRLAAHPRIVGLKDSGGNLIKMAEVVARAPAGFSVLAGTASFLLAALAVGAVGGVLALANIAPRQCVTLLDLFKSGDLAGARALQQRLIAPNTAITSGMGIPALKVAMDLLGYQGGAPRLPLMPLDAQQKAHLEAVLTDAGLMSVLQ